MTLHEQMELSDSQRYPEKLCLIKYELDNNFYNLKKMIIFKSDLRISAAGKHVAELKHFQARKTTISSTLLIR